MGLVQDVEQETAKVGKFARYVVAKRVAAVAAVAVVLNVLIAYHVITPDVSNHVQGYIKDGLDALAALVAVLYAQKGVTPLNDPRNNAGTPLVPVTRAAAAVANAVAELPPAAAAAAEQDTQDAVVPTPEPAATDPAPAPAAEAAPEEVAAADMSAESAAASADETPAPTA